MLELQVDQRHFNSFVPVATVRLRLLQSVYMAGHTRVLSAPDEVRPFCCSSVVNSISRCGALFRTYNRGCGGLLGAGLVVLELENNEFKLADMHVGTNDDSVSPPPIKKRRCEVGADAKRESESSEFVVILPTIGFVRFSVCLMKWNSYDSMEKPTH